MTNVRLIGYIGRRVVASHELAKSRIGVERDAVGIN